MIKASKKPPLDSVAVFRSIARKGESLTHISPHQYEEEFDTRG